MMWEEGKGKGERGGGMMREGERGSGERANENAR